jgi:predicted nucleotide-binding protein (sugar kinase/HSP70/actin superfamily)
MQHLEIVPLVAAERARLRAAAGLPPPARHYHRPAELPFLASERRHVTILIGGLTSLHDRLVSAAFQACGYRCENLPTPGLASFQLGRQYCNVGQCNPAYFTIGNLLHRLQQLETSGLSRGQIIASYVFFTSGTCGPCRFGMYEAEYRFALKNAGFDGFRVLTFEQNAGVKATTGEPGLELSLHFGLSALNAVNCGDVLHDAAHRLQPFAIDDAQASHAIDDVVALLHECLRSRRPVEILDLAPRWTQKYLKRHPPLRAWLSGLLTFGHHLRGADYRNALAVARARLAGIEVDRLRVKPVVKVTGEFWAATTDGAGNFDMFRFLEREGAEVRLDPVGGWVMYLLYQAKARAAIARRLGRTRRLTFAALAHELRFARRRLLFALGERFWSREYRRAAHALGGLADDPPPQDELARLAQPFYNSLARGGEGHLEVGKTIYYARHRKCHMVLSLKPFGCLPSTQSDGVQSAVAAQLKDLNFLSIETSGEGELNAHSRVQMALGEAKAAARREFEEALGRTGRALGDIRAYVDAHPELRHPFYRVPRHAGVVGTAANFVLHVGGLMGGRP